MNHTDLQGETTLICYASILTGAEVLSNSAPNACQLEQAIDLLKAISACFIPFSPILR